MNKKILHLLMLVFAAIVILIIASHAGNPELYSIKDTSGTYAQQDPGTVKKVSGSDADALIPLMSELMDSTGEIVMNIKVNDYDSAEKDFEEYEKASRRFDNLVVRLDLTDTDIGEFKRHNQKTRSNLENLVNKTRRFDDLDKLEIKYRDENNPDRIYSVTYEGEALSQQIQEDARTYTSRREPVTAITARYGVNSTSYDRSMNMLDEIVDGTRERQSKRIAPTPTPHSKIMINITPQNGTYGDALSISGAKGSSKLFIDSRQVAASESGTFLYEIERIRSGKHLAYLAAGSELSDLETFEVFNSATNITLLENGTGTLTAGKIPVRNAPVTIHIDQTETVTTETDADGNYNITLPAGNHELRAVFDSPEFPLEPSESPTLTLEIQEQGKPSLVVFLGAALFLIIGGYGAYLSRRRKPEPEVERVIEEEVNPVIQENLQEHALRITASMTPKLAADALFRDLLMRLGEIYQIPDYHSRTPRELADCFRELAVFPAVKDFVDLHEAIRYAGQETGPEEVQALIEYYLATLEGETE